MAYLSYLATCVRVVHNACQFAIKAKPRSGSHFRVDFVFKISCRTTRTARLGVCRTETRIEKPLDEAERYTRGCGLVLWKWKTTAMFSLYGYGVPALVDIINFALSCRDVWPPSAGMVYGNGQILRDGLLRRSLVP